MGLMEVVFVDGTRLWPVLPRAAVGVAAVTRMPTVLDLEQTQLEMRRDPMVERALGIGAAQGVEPAVVATATARAVGLLLAEVQPLVGELAARALYARSLHLARSSLQRAAPGQLDTREQLLVLLHNDLAARPAVDAERAGRALLRSFADLLASLIGQGLTQRLLRTAWGIYPTELPSEESRNGR
jgi:hypothetical protein